MLIFPLSKCLSPSFANQSALHLKGNYFIWRFFFVRVFTDRSSSTKTRSQRIPGTCILPHTGLLNYIKPLERLCIYEQTCSKKTFLAQLSVSDFSSVGSIESLTKIFRWRFTRHSCILKSMNRMNLILWTKNAITLAYNNSNLRELFQLILIGARVVANWNRNQEYNKFTLLITNAFNSGKCYSDLLDIWKVLSLL